MRFSKVRQLLADFQFIPSSSLDFQVGLNLDETTPLKISNLPVAICILEKGFIVMFRVMYCVLGLKNKQTDLCSNN